MDLNELLHKHQVEVMKAAQAGDGPGRDNHYAKVAEYAERVRALRTVHPEVGNSPAPDGPPAIIYGTYAGETAKPDGVEPTASWEDEGGAVRHPSIPLPDGIETRLVPEYRVGPYVYQDLDLAVAEHLRQLSTKEPDVA